MDFFFSNGGALDGRCHAFGGSFLEVLLAIMAALSVPTLSAAVSPIFTLTITLYFVFMYT